MTLLLIPLSLLALFLLTSLLCTLASLAIPSRLDANPSLPSSPIAGFYPEWITLDRPDVYKTTTTTFSSIYSTYHLSRRSLSLPLPSTPTPSLPSPPSPIRVKLHWRSSSMSAVSETKVDMTGGKNSDASQATNRATKRFSIQLPLAENKVVAQSPVTETPRSISPVEMPEKGASIDPGNFLVALAAQERRVLELKEELQKAETDLIKLKRQWAHHEAIRKRQEIRQQAEPMRSIKSPSQDLTMAQEMKSASELAKRRSIVVKPKQSQRKVFEGGRHTRALSLLSPTSLVNRGSIPEPIDTTARTSKTEHGPATAIPRATTPVSARGKNTELSKEDMMATGKQIMGDLKEGLWTFIEDLRQATVGDEAMSATRTRQVDFNMAPPPVPQQAMTIDVEEDLITLSPAPTPKKKTNGTSIITAADNQPIQQHTEEILEDVKSTKDASDDEGWSNWDSPPSKAGSSNFSSTTRSTPRSSLSSDIKRQSATFDQIPWPALQKLTPGNLTRTASHLMTQWEKSLSEPSAQPSTTEDWSEAEPQLL